MSIQRFASVSEDKLSKIVENAMPKNKARNGKFTQTILYRLWSEWA